MPGRLTPLGYRNFGLYWVGFLFSNSGRWAEAIGVLWLVYDLTESPVAVGLIGAMRAIPALFVGPMAGVLADRVDQRRLMMATQILTAGLSLVLAVLVMTGLVELWHIYLQVVITASVHSFDQAARQSLFPRLVPKRLLPEAVTLNAMAGRSSNLIGPAIGGLLIGAAGVAAPFAANAILDLGLILAVALIRGVVPRTPAEGSSIRIELKAGFQHIARFPVVRALLTLEVVFHLFHLNAAIITIVGRERLGVGPEGLGGMLAAPALGAMFGIVALLVVGFVGRQGRFNIICTVVYATGLVAFALAPSYELAVATLVGIGMLDALLGVGRQSIIQLVTPGRMRGRTMANTRMVTGTSGELAQTQSGLLSGAFGSTGAIAVAAGILTIGALLVAKFSPELWNFTRAESPHAVDQAIDSEPAA